MIKFADAGRIDWMDIDEAQPALDAISRRRAFGSMPVGSQLRKAKARHRAQGHRPRPKLAATAKAYRGNPAVS